MSVPTSISQLSTTPSLNSPAGSEPVGNNAALYLNAHAAFIAQIANATQFKPTVPISMNSLQINNLANGTAATDAVNLSQLRSYLPIGAIMLYSGSVASIEPHRILWRLGFLRESSHEQEGNQVFPGSPGARSASGT